MKHHSETHGLLKNGNVPPEYNSWCQMIQRCTNPNYAGYHNYGGAGITVCDRWKNSFSYFLSDMGYKPSKLHSIDRHPNKNGNYEPSNCRWATWHQQSRGRKSNVWIEFNGFNMVQKDWAIFFGIKYQSLTYKLQKGRTMDNIYNFYKSKKHLEPLSDFFNQTYQQ